MTVELRHIILYHRKLVIWHVEIKIDITSERFELEPQIEYHITIYPLALVQEVESYFGSSKLS